MKHIWKRLSALLLALIMTLSLLPMAALAVREDGEELPAEPVVDQIAAPADQNPVGSGQSAAALAADNADEAIEATDETRDIDRATYTITASSENSTTHSSEGPKQYAADGNTGKFWHSDLKSEGAEHWIAVELAEAKWVSAFRYLPRTDTTNAVKGSAGNGFVTDYRIETSMDGEAWTTPENGTGTWEPFNSENKSTGAWQVANFTPVRAKYVKLVGVHTVCNNGQPQDAFMHANEIRVVAARNQEVATYTVSGTVTNAAGAPLANAVVTIGGQTATTNADGAYEIADLTDGSYTATVALEGYELENGADVVVNGANITGHVLQMRAVNRTITGTVIGLSGAEITLVRADGDYAFVPSVTPVTTGESGSYTLSVNAVPAGRYRVRAAKAGYRAALSEPMEVTTTSAVAEFQAAEIALEAVDTTAVWYNFDMSDTSRTPQYTAGANVAVQMPSRSLFMRFNGNSQTSNTVKINGTKFGDAVVEFDATRGGTNTSNGFGVLLRTQEGSEGFFAGLNSAGEWYAGNTGAVSGPSFASGETRHFKITLSNGKVTLVIDGVSVLNEVSVSAPSGLGELAFTSSVPQTEVTVKNLYITRNDPVYTLTMPAELTGHMLVSSALDMPLKQAGTENGYVVHEGDVVNVYSADPAVKEMTAPLTVYKTVDNSVSSEENILHMTTTTSAHQERGYYVQVQIPGYDVTLDPTMKNAVTGVSIEADVDTGALRAVVAPADATADYQWYRETEVDVWTPIATGSAYAPQSADTGKRLKVEATGKGEFGGKVFAITEPITSNVASVTILRAGDPTVPEMINGVDQTASLKAVITPGVAATLTWSSSDESIATVQGQTRAVPDEDGVTATATAVVTGHRAGKVTITLTTENGKIDTREVEVGVGVANVIFEDTSEVTLYTNGKTAAQPSTAALVPTVNPTSATYKAVSWSSSDETVATVDENGVVTAVAPGIATVTATSKQNTGAFAFRAVNVVALPTALSLDMTIATLTVGAGDATHEVVVTPTMTPANASNQRVNWITSNAAVATVAKPENWETNTGSQAAIVTAVGVGTATITAVSEADSSVKATVTVTVKQRITGRVTISGEPYVGSELEANINNIVQGAKDGLTYQWYWGNKTTEDAKIPGATGKTYIPGADDLGNVLTVVVTADGITYVGTQSCSTEVITKAPNETRPNGLQGMAPSTQNGSDGKIAGLDASKRYEYQSADADENDATAWVKVDANSAEITGLTPGNYRVRFQETAVQQASAARTATVPQFGTTVYKVEVDSAMQNGDVTCEPAQAAEGAVVSLTVQPSVGYQLKAGTLQVTTAGNSQVTVTAVEGAENEFTFTMPGENVTVTAQFEKKTYTITHNLYNISCDMVSHNHTAAHGEVFTITLTPEAGYEMPKALELTITGAVPAQEFHDYTYTVSRDDPAKRVLTFAHGVTDNITISGAAERITYPVSGALERVRLVNTPSRAEWHAAFVAALTPETGYVLPETITITVGGVVLTVGTDYEYSSATGVVQIKENLINGAVEITAKGTKIVTALEKVSISGIAQVGQRLTANLTPAEADGHVTYQWYWVADGVETLIPNATGRSRVITEQSLDKSILVKATALDGHAFSGTVSSQPTGTVISAEAAEVVPQWVQIRRDSVTLEQGKTDTLIAYVGPDNATNKTVLWSSSDENVVTVDNGVITAVGLGTASITVRTQADETVTDICAITVTASRDILARAEDVFVTYDGMAYGITVTVTNPAGGNSAVTYSVDGIHYSANNPTFSAAGEHIVWYQVTSAGMTTLQGQGKVTIEKATPEISLTADQSRLPQGGTVTLTVTVPTYVDPNGLYLSADDLMIPVEKVGEGSYTAQLPATAKTYRFTVTLTGTDNYNGASASYKVTVGKRSSAVSPTTNTVTKKDEDGSVTTIVTDAATGTVTETVARPDGTKSETVTTKDGDVTITVTNPKGEELAKVELPATIPAPETEFVDISATPWAEEAINKVAGLKLVKGIGNNRYAPATPMSRGALATVLHRLSQGKSDCQVFFNDVEQGKYYTAGVAWAAEAGVVTGITAELYAPEQVITREQLAVMMARYARLVGLNTGAHRDALDAFIDGEDTGSWAVDGVAWCVENGILKGKGGDILDPTAQVTRAEVAVMLDRFIDLLK